MSSVVIEYELGIRKAVRKINRVAAGHHLVLITIRHQHRVMNARQIGRRLTPPSMDSLQLGGESDERNRLSRFSVRSFSRFRNSRAALRPLGVLVKKR